MSAARTMIKVFAHGLSSATFSCILVMALVRSQLDIITSVQHWGIAFLTGVYDGAISVVASKLLILTAFGRRLESTRYGRSLLIGIAAVFADALSHPGYVFPLEAVLTGIVAGMFAWLGSFLFD